MWEYQKEKGEELYSDGNRVRVIHPNEVQTHNDIPECREELEEGWKKIWESSQKILIPLVHDLHWVLISAQKRGNRF